MEENGNTGKCEWALRKGENSYERGERWSQGDSRTSARWLCGSRTSSHIVRHRNVLLCCCAVTGETGLASLRPVELQYVNSSIEDVGSLSTGT